MPTHKITTMTLLTLVITYLSSMITFKDGGTYLEEYWPQTGVLGAKYSAGALR